MKTISYLLVISACLLLCPSIVRGQWDIQLDAGYNFLRTGKTLIGENSTYSFTRSGGITTMVSSDEAGIYASWGQGIHIDLRASTHLNRYLSAGLELSYLRGKTFSFTDENIINTGGGITGTKDEYSGHINAFRAAPFVRFEAPCRHFTPYGRIGLLLNLSQTMQQSRTTVQTVAPGATITAIEKATVKGKFNDGLNAALGAALLQDHPLSFFAELSFSSTTLTPKHRSVDTYTVGGLDELNTLTTSQRETDYVKKHSTMGSANVNEPTVELTIPEPAGGFGISVGVNYRIGGDRRTTAAP